MARETRFFKTPVDGIDIEIKTYITGREYEEIEDILYKGIKLSAIADKGSQAAKVGMDDGSFIKEQKHKAIELMIVSVKGETENVLDKVLDMEKDDYLFVIDEIEKVTGDTEEVKKKEK